MSKTLSTQFNVQLSGTYAKTADFSSPTALILRTLSDSLANGTGLDQADLCFADQRTLGATTAETLDLSGSLTDDFGDTLAFARIKGIIIALNTTTAGYTLEIGGAASNQFAAIVGDGASDKIIVRAGGFLILWAPDATAYAVTNSASDLLKINNPNAASIIYDIILIGCSA